MILDYVRTEYGKDTYIRLLKKHNIRSVLGLNDDELRDNVVEYIKKTYCEIPFELQKETEHFKFYCEPDDVSWIEGVISVLEDNYDRITNDLRAELTEKCEVVLYPDYGWF